MEIYTLKTNILNIKEDLSEKSDYDVVGIIGQILESNKLSLTAQHRLIINRKENKAYLLPRDTSKSHSYLPDIKFI